MTPERFERLLTRVITKNNPAFNIQLAHLEKALNRNRLARSPAYRAPYNRIRAFVGPNYNARLARGRSAVVGNAATLIQRHWRGTRTRKPKTALVITYGSPFMYAIEERTPILKKLHRSKVRRNINAL